MTAEKLTRQAVVEQALELADTEGLEAVTIRRLAQELGVTPMALYWHFKNKEQLLHGVADHVLAELTPEFETGAPWNARLRAMVEALVRIMRRHSSTPELFSVITELEVTSFTRATDTALGLLTTAGFPLDEAYWISSYLLHGTIWLVRANPGRPRDVAPGDFAEWRRQKRLALEAVSPDLFPRIVEFAKTLEPGPDIERYYTFGIDLLMSAVETMAARRA